MEELLQKIGDLSDEDYKNLMIYAFSTTRPPIIQKQIVNGIRKRGSRSATKHQGSQEESGVDTQSTVLSWPTLPVCKSRSAWQVPFIFRGDLLKEGGHIFYDIEKVTLETVTKKHEVIGAALAVVNENGKLIFWSFVKPTRNVCQYFTNLTGLTKSKLEMGLPLEMVQYFARMCFYNNTVVGFDIEDDIKCLGIQNSFSTDDLTDYYFETKLAPNSWKEINEKYSVKDLCMHFFQEHVQCGIHSAIIDARKTRALWIKKEELIRNQPKFKENVVRSKKKPFKLDRGDICTCANTKKMQTEEISS